jgi:hypothetical protein
MNDPKLAGACAGNEFDIADLHDGALGPEAARNLQAHLDGCARCRDWQARHAALDAALARELPRPQLSAGFGARLRERLERLGDPAPYRDLRSTAELEYERTVRALRRAARRRVIIVAAAGAVMLAAGLALASLFGPQLLTLARGFDAGQGTAALGSLGATAAICALAWSAMRGMLPGVRLPG